MNAIQRGRLIQLIKQHFPYTEPCDADHVLQWEIIAETLNALGPSQTIDQWIEDWESIRLAVKEKVEAIKSRESDSSDLPEDLKLSEEDHRVMKICGFETDYDRMANLVKLLDCRATSPFENDCSGDSDNKDKRDSPIEGVEGIECINDTDDIKAEKNAVLQELEEQKKINGQLAELLAALKMPA